MIYPAYVPELASEQRTVAHLVMRVDRGRARIRNVVGAGVGPDGRVAQRNLVEQQYNWSIEAQRLLAFYKRVS